MYSWRQASGCAELTACANLATSKVASLRKPRGVEPADGVPHHLAEGFATEVPVALRRVLEREIVANVDLL